jgi:hypothetical protein
MGAGDIARISGLNLGNLVFRHALGTILRDLDQYKPVDYVELKELLDREGVGDTVISCANWLGIREEDEASNKVRADLIERIAGKVASVGLGVQAPQGSTIVELGPQSQRLAKTLAEMGGLLSVRDSVTERTLRSIGIDNVCITGCPSNFINLSPELGSSIAEKAHRLAEVCDNWADIRTAISEFTGGHPRAGVVLRKMLEALLTGPSFYVAQSPALLPVVRRESSELPAVYSQNSFLSRQELLRTFRAKALSFSSVESWLYFSRSCDLSFGMRIHGTMVPLQAGVPSLLIGHDARTSGLASTMGVPTMTPEQFLELDVATPAGLFHRVASEMRGYDATRARLAARIERFLDSNDLPCHPGLRRLAVHP